jgi:hypothetical protein
LLPWVAEVLVKKESRAGRAASKEGIAYFEFEISGDVCRRVACAPGKNVRGKSRL